jgi:NAD-dependent deacetylase
MSIEEDTRKLSRLIDGAKRVVAFTGAGISTECGIPDFRSKDSEWKRHPPMPFKEFLANEDNQVEAWRRKFAMDDFYRGARPGRGHHALARLMETGKLTGIITQNIDGLHRLAGAPDDEIVELHGSGTHASCLTCGVRHELSRIRERFEINGRAPRCLCGGVVKSATISFGQAMPGAALARARELSLDCDLFIAIGSTLVVYPAAAFPLLAKENGACLVIVNRDSTPFDDRADLILRGDIGATLAPLAA